MFNFKVAYSNFSNMTTFSLLIDHLTIQLSPYIGHRKLNLSCFDLDLPAATIITKLVAIPIELIVVKLRF